MIDQYFLQFYFRCIQYVVSSLGFYFRKHLEILMIQSWRFHGYLYSVLLRLDQYHLFY